MKNRYDAELEDLNRDVDKVFHSFDWSALTPGEVAEKSLLFEMMHTQIYANKKQIELVKWTKGTAIAVAVVGSMSLILQVAQWLWK